MLCLATENQRNGEIEIGLTVAVIPAEKPFLPISGVNGQGLQSRSLG